MARPFTRSAAPSRLTGAMQRRRARAATLTRPAFHYAVLCVWPVSL